MRGFTLAFIVLFLLTLAGSGSTVAQDATPVTDAGASDEVAFTTLAEAEINDLPTAPAFLGLVRFTFPVGAATPEGGDPGPVLAVVESGSLVAEINGPAESFLAGVTTSPAATPGSSGPLLREGDALLVPEGTSAVLRNDGPDKASLLVVMVFREDPFGGFAQQTLDGVAVDLLASGMVESIPPTKALVTLVRQTYAPGASLEPAESLGPVVGYTDSGEIVYIAESGESTHTSPSAPEAISGPTEVTLEPGDGFVEEAGTVSGARNDGDTPASLLVAFVWPAEEMDPTPSSGTATPGA
jgi:hypothetical protein